MKYTLFTILLMLGPLVAYAQADTEPVSESQAASPDTINIDSEWVVVFTDPRPARLRGWRTTGYSTQSGEYDSVLNLKRFGNKMASKYNMELRDQWLIQSLGVYCLVVRFNGDQQHTITELKKNKRLQWIQPSNEFKLLAAASSFSNTLAFETPIPKGIDGTGAVIAIIDSAVDKSHQDLAKAITKSDDFVVAGTQVQGGEMHGTAIAGVMVAHRDTKLGVAGVAPAAALEAYRGCWESSANNETHCNTLSLARALDAVSKSKADILNLSLSGPKDDLLDRLIQRIIDQGKMVVAAFDPTRPNIPRFPSQREGVLIVRAQDLDSMYADVFTAPGSRVVVSPGNRYDFMQGHSVAAAYVSGILALKKQVLDRRGESLRSDWRKISKLNAAKDLVKDLL